jgi:hypothetical protein
MDARLVKDGARPWWDSKGFLCGPDRPHPPAPGRDRPGTGSNTGPPPQYLGHFPHRHRTLYSEGWCRGTVRGIL